MLCGSPLRADLNGSQVSILPVARSRRWTPAKPLFWVQTLPSTSDRCGLTMLICAASILRSAGSVLPSRPRVSVAEPQIAGAIGAQTKAAGRSVFPVLGVGEFGDLAAFGI